MMSMKTSKPPSTGRFPHKAAVGGLDFPFGPPPEEYNYRCSHCRYEMKVNEAIIAVEIAKAEFEGRHVEGFMPLLGCPQCNRETMEYTEGRKPAR